MCCFRFLSCIMGSNKPKMIIKLNIMCRYFIRWLTFRNENISLSKKYVLVPVLKICITFCELLHGSGLFIEKSQYCSFNFCIVSGYTKTN